MAESILSTVFLGFGVVVMIAAIVMIIGFVISMPFGVRAAVKEHHEHPEMHPHKPHNRQMQFKFSEHHLPHKADFRKAWDDLAHPAA
jgi:hypothetical protein